MSNDLRIHRLNTGWLESTAGVSLMGEGKHPDVPGGQIRSYGWSTDIERPDGSVVSGTMVPAPAWYIEGAEKKILVDTGTGKSEEVSAVQQRYGIHLAMTTPPENEITGQLSNLGVRPEEIDLVIHTHLHFDHVGSNELFPNATFLVNQAEIPWALCPPPYGVFYYREFGHHVQKVLDQIQFVHGDCQVAPGIRMVYTGGHSPGHSIVLVETTIGSVAIAGDAVYNYRNLEYEWPQGPVFDVGETVQSMQTLKAADIILANHDPLFEELFPSGVIGPEPLSEKTTAYMRRIRTKQSFPLTTYKEGGPKGAMLQEA